jgi:hypothetical protein
MTPRVSHRLAAACLMLIVATLVSGRAAQPEPVTIQVDTAAAIGPMHPFWAWFGHDEPNYTYTANGTKLLSSLQALSPVPVFMRVHNLLTSGDGSAALKWGSTNVYTEDAAGRPVYDWTVLARIVDSYRARGLKPFVQLGFMPEALSSAPAGVSYRPSATRADRCGWTGRPSRSSSRCRARSTPRTTSSPPRRVRTSRRSASSPHGTESFELPRKSVSFVKVTW